MDYRLDVKKINIIILAFIFALFFEMNNCFADEVDYYFNFSDSALPTNDILYTTICNNDLLDSGSKSTGISSCTVYCKNGSTGTQRNGNCRLTTDGAKNYVVNNYSIEDKLLNFKTTLEDITCDGKSCYEYIKEDYCNNWSNTEKICKDLKKLETEAPEGTATISDDGIRCRATVNLYKSKQNSEELKKFYIVYNEKNNTLKTSSINAVGSPALNGELSQGWRFSTDSVNSKDNKFYLYSKGSTYESFKSSYINELNKNNNICPEINFCLVSLEKIDNYYTWYAEIGDDFEASKYTGVCQKMDGTGTNTGIVIDDTVLPSLFTGTNTIDSCSDILEEGGDLQTMLKNLVTIIKVAVPIILFVLGTLDIVKAIFAGSEDNMKKATSKFIRRLLIAVVIFLAPTIIKFILGIASTIWPDISTDFCGIL